MNALLAVNWEWELRGSLIVIISVAVLCGSVYLILGTNMGARLGFLVALAGLAGWMFLMGAIWWSYGKGLLGPDSSWKAVGGKTIIRDSDKLYEVGILGAPYEQVEVPSEDAAGVEAALLDSEWIKLDSALPAYQQAGSAGSVLMEESEALAAGEFAVVNVYDKGGERGPSFWDDRIPGVLPRAPLRARRGRAVGAPAQ